MSSPENTREPRALGWAGRLSPARLKLTEAASLALGVGVEASLDMENGRGRVKMGGGKGSVGTPRPERKGPGRVPGVGSPPPAKVPERVPERVSCGSEGTGGLAPENWTGRIGGNSVVRPPSDGLGATVFLSD